MEKLAWTLTRPPRDDADAFRKALRSDIADLVRSNVDGVLDVVVTFQDPGQPTNALIPVDASDRPVDAVVEITTATSYVPLQTLHHQLGERCAHFQGWRVRPTTIYDTSPPVAVGESKPLNALVIFETRLDGTTPEHFSRNWFIHAGHLDGEEAESAASRAERQKDEIDWPGGRYVQNRVVEPVTPTAWLIHGYTQLLMPFFTPPIEDMPPYDRVRGEAPFDEWPPRIIQGEEVRVL